MNKITTLSSFLVASLALVACGSAENADSEASTSNDELGWCPTAQRSQYETCLWNGGGRECDRSWPLCSDRSSASPSGPTCYGKREEWRRMTTDQCKLEHTFGTSAVPSGTMVSCTVGLCDGRQVELGCRFVRCISGTPCGNATCF